MPENNASLFSKYYQYEICNMKCIYKLVKENNQLKAQNQVVTDQKSGTNTLIADLQKKLSLYDKHYEEKLNTDFSHKLVGIKE